MLHWGQSGKSGIVALVVRRAVLDGRDLDLLFDRRELGVAQALHVLRPHAFAGVVERAAFAGFGLFPADGFAAGADVVVSEVRRPMAGAEKLNFSYFRDLAQVIGEVAERDVADGEVFGSPLSADVQSLAHEGRGFGNQRD